jgi:hypothetical protein
MVMSIELIPSLFPDEWRACFGAELQQILDDAPVTDHDALTAEFLQTHPPIFQGVYTSPTIALGSTLGREPRLSRRDNQLWVELWSQQAAEAVLEVIPFAHHHLVALVLRLELIIIRAHEYEHVCGTLNGER